MVCREWLGALQLLKTLSLAPVPSQWLIYSPLIVIEDDEGIRTYKSAVGKAPTHPLGRRFGVSGRCSSEPNRDLPAAAILALAGVRVRDRVNRPLWAGGLVLSHCFRVDCFCCFFFGTPIWASSGVQGITPE